MLLLSRLRAAEQKRNINIPNVLGKIAGIVVIVAALVILGPPIARYGLGVVDGLSMPVIW